MIVVLTYLFEVCRDWDPSILRVESKVPGESLSTSRTSQLVWKICFLNQSIVTPISGSIFGGQFLSFFDERVFKNQNTSSTFKKIIHVHPTLLLYSWNGFIYFPPTRLRTFDKNVFMVSFPKKETSQGFLGDLKFVSELSLTPVAGSIFGPLSQTHISKSEF